MCECDYNNILLYSYIFINSLMVKDSINAIISNETHEASRLI
jgi:hypothetical protein